MLILAVSSSAANAQRRYVIADRTNDALFRLYDADQSLFIDEPGELNRYFDALNAPGTLGPMNPSTLAVSRFGVCIMGDQQNRNVYRLVDLNGDGDTEDAGESIVFADVTNASGVSFAFPTGAGFDLAGNAYVVNAGNASGNDGIYRLIDVNADGDAQDAGEITDYVTVGAFGPGNGPYSPQEMFIDCAGVGYVRNSSAGLHGVYRFEDLNHNSRADDPGEFTVYFDATNASGVTVAAGFPLEPDRARPGSMYVHQIVPVGIDQVFRLTDTNADHDAQDAGEAVLVWQDTGGSFTGIDLLSMRSGDLLVTDNTGLTVLRLHDGNSDGDFLDAGEAIPFFANSGAQVAAVRQIASIELLGDIDDDGDVDATDAALLADVLAGLDTNADHVLLSDLNCDGSPNGLDVQVMAKRLIGP
ncbi:MAG: dockerin type I domain-containing protein [Phycisphaerae bacterium]